MRELETPTKGKRDEGCDGQAITSRGWQKSRVTTSRWAEGLFPVTQKNWGDEADYQPFMPIVKALNDKIYPLLPSRLVFACVCGSSHTHTILHQLFSPCMFHSLVCTHSFTCRHIHASLSFILVDMTDVIETVLFKCASDLQIHLFTEWGILSFHCYDAIFHAVIQQLHLPWITGHYVVLLCSISWRVFPPHLCEWPWWCSQLLFKHQSAVWVFPSLYLCI